MDYQCSWFCERYREWSGKLGLVMRQKHWAGKKTFIDYASQTMDVVVPLTGEVRAAQIFVAVLGASRLHFCQGHVDPGSARLDRLPPTDFQFFGGMTELMVIDNLKSVVSKACPYEPDINQTYQEMAAHYSTAVLPVLV
ncbi:hypothetical protein DFAR_630026 [Desulfarculales bacterium]